ncbi:hypothetical protein [Akkermansia sp.]|uniref:hypothetical protein n=1 Tax=Akkermansia sp. TaxID=1872421 RepID=UPI0025C3C5EE|nr:hypothetical protein [Akkermansia sp.]
MLKKIIFWLTFLLCILILSFFLISKNNKRQACHLEETFNASSPEEIRNKYDQIETLTTHVGVYTSICIPNTRHILPNGIILIKMPSGKTRIFYGGYYSSHNFLSNLKNYAEIIIEEDPEYIIEQKKVLNFENAMEVSLEIFTENSHFSEL